MYFLFIVEVIDFDNLGVDLCTMYMFSVFRYIIFIYETILEVLVPLANYERNYFGVE